LRLVFVLELGIFIDYMIIVYRIKKKKPIFSSCSLSTINQNCNFNNTKAKEELGFNPRSVKKGLNDTVDWFYENKKDLINPPL